MNISSDIISTNGLCKSYGANRVLDNVTLNIGGQKLIGFLGPNGAGKTTTLRILLGLLAANSGDAKIFGLCCRQKGKTIRQRVGYLPGDVHLYSSLSGMATLQHFARVRRMNCDLEIRRLSQKFELPLHRTVRKYSTGMRQKLGLIQALMHKPDLLLLDEPTSALDPLVRTLVFEELRHVVDEGRTVLFSSHTLNEVEELCDEVVILRSGKIVEHQQIDILRKRALRKITLIFDEASSIPDEIPDSLQLLERNESSLQCTWSGELDELLSWIGRLEVRDLMIERPDLNDLFMTYYANRDTASNSAPAIAGGGNV